MVVICHGEEEPWGLFRTLEVCSSHLYLLYIQIIFLDPFDPHKFLLSVDLIGSEFSNLKTLLASFQSSNPNPAYNLKGTFFMLKKWFIIQIVQAIKTEFRRKDKLQQQFMGLKNVGWVTNPTWWFSIYVIFCVIVSK